MTEEAPIKKETPVEPVEPVETAEPVKRRPVRKFFKNFVNVRRWIFYDEVKSYGKFVLGVFKTTFFPGKKTYITETFEEALIRLNLTEQDISNKKKFFLRTALLYLLISICLVIYGSYLLFGSYIIVATIVYILGVLMLVYAYRESFWYMQVSQRKLGCTFKDWRQFIFHRNTL